MSKTEDKEKWITVNGKHMQVSANSGKTSKPQKFDKLNNQQSKKKGKK